MTDTPSPEAIAAAEEAIRRQRDETRQLGSADIREMTPQPVEAARERGQFADLLRGVDNNPSH